MLTRLKIVFILPVRFAFTYDMNKDCDLGVFPNGQYLKGQGECFILSVMEGIEFGQEFYIFVYEKGSHLMQLSLASNLSKDDLKLGSSVTLPDVHSAGY